MPIKTPRQLIVIAAVTVACLAVVSLGAQQPGREAAENSAKVVAARQEMRKAAEQLVELRQRAYQFGEIGIEEVVRAQQQLLAVELKLAKTPTERAKVLSQQLQLAKDAEKAAQTRFDSGLGPQSDVLQARIARLEIEVSILEETE